MILLMVQHNKFIKTYQPCLNTSKLKYKSAYIVRKIVNTCEEMFTKSCFINYMFTVATLSKRTYHQMVN